MVADPASNKNTKPTSLRYNLGTPPNGASTTRSNPTRMFTNFNCKTADELWNSVACNLATSKKAWQTKDSRNGPTKELLHATFSISDPTQRWIQIRPKPINLALALAEVVWILNGRDDSSFLRAFFPKLSDFAGDTIRFQGAYGKRLRCHFEIGDQLLRAYNVLKNDPKSRQVVLSIWDPNCDLPHSDGRVTSADTPCNISSILKIDNGTLEWVQVMRSNDIFRGLPNNIVQFTSLQEIMSGWLGIKPGSYNHISDSLHAYESDLEQIRPQMNGHLLKNSDRFDQGYEQSLECFERVAACIDCILEQGSQNAEQMLEAYSNQLPEAFRNILSVMAAEITRRSGALDLSQTLVDRCTNDLFVAMWNNWMHREHKQWAVRNKIPAHPFTHVTPE